MRELIGFRQYLKSEQSYQDLKNLILESVRAVEQGRNDTEFHIAICGEDPREFLRKNNLLRHVQLFDYSRYRFSPNQLVKHFVGDYPNGSAVKIIYYSPYPEGLTYPIDLFTQIAVFLNFDHLGVSDSDFQIPFAEMLRAADFHREHAVPNTPVVTFPRRKRRGLDAENYPINRWAMEDIENLYVYFLSNIRFLEMKLDIQSGLFFTNRRANLQLDFNRVGKWVGTLHVAIALLRDPSVQVFQVEVDTRMQEDSTISFQVQCRKIDELYDYYLIPMENIIRIAMDNPRKYLMNDWNQGLNRKQIREKLEHIYQAYLEFKRK